MALHTSCILWARPIPRESWQRKVMRTKGIKWILPRGSSKRTKWDALGHQGDGKQEPTLSSNKRTRSQTNSNKMGFHKDPVGSWTGMLKLHMGLKKNKKGWGRQFYRRQSYQSSAPGSSITWSRDGIQGNDDSHSSPGILSWLLLERAYRLNIQLQQGRARVCLPQGTCCNVALAPLVFPVHSQPEQVPKNSAYNPWFCLKTERQCAKTLIFNSVFKGM